MTVVVLLLMLLISLAPSLIAWSRSHRQFVPILVLNVLVFIGALGFGWVAALGWVVALVWSLVNYRDDKPRQTPVLYPAKSIYECPVCGAGKTAYLTCNHPACPDGRDINSWRSA